MKNRHGTAPGVVACLGEQQASNHTIRLEEYKKQVSFETMLLMMGSGAETLPAEHSARSCYGKFEQPQEQRAGDSFLIRNRPEGLAGQSKDSKPGNRFQCATSRSLIACRRSGSLAQSRLRPASL